MRFKFGGPCRASAFGPNSRERCVLITNRFREFNCVGGGGAERQNGSNSLLKNPGLGCSVMIHLVTAKNGSDNEVDGMDLRGEIRSNETHASITDRDYRTALIHAASLLSIRALK
jgi:hypothetical protein